MSFKNYLSPSSLLAIYFDEVPINNVNVQEGIFRGCFLDKAIENFCEKEKNIYPKLEIIQKRCLLQNLLWNDLYNQGKMCFIGFLNFYYSYDIEIIETQKYCKNEKYLLHGYIDAIIKINNKNYIIDWKSKKEFINYNEINWIEKYDEYLKWCNDNRVISKSLNTYRNTQKGYNVINFRYVLQVIFYWIILGCPKDFELLIGYFATNSKYYIFTFNKEKAQKIAMTLIKYIDGSKKEQAYLNIKLKRLNWMEYINWRPFH